MIKEDIFMLSSKIELMKNANEIKECPGALELKKKKESLPLGYEVWLRLFLNTFNVFKLVLDSRNWMP